MPLPFGLRRRKLFSILSLTTGSNERWNRKESQMDDKTLHSAKSAICGHLCKNPSCHLKPHHHIFTVCILTCPNRKNAGVTNNIPCEWNRHSIIVKVISHLWFCVTGQNVCLKIGLLLYFHIKIVWMFWLERVRECFVIVHDTMMTFLAPFAALWLHL